MFDKLSRSELEILAAREANRLVEEEFTRCHSYTRDIMIEGIPKAQVEDFCRLVEEELLYQGKKVKRQGASFKIETDQIGT